MALRSVGSAAGPGILRRHKGFALPIHPTAIVDPSAEIDPAANIGPYVVIEAGVAIGPGTTVGPFTHIEGLTTIGRDNRIGSGCAIGGAPQHTGYAGAPTRLVIGDGNTIREGASLHRAFKEGEATIVGDGCFIMGHAHVAHDCRLGDGVIVANNALLAGHVQVGDRAFVSGGSVVHQFVRIGRLAMLSGLSGVGQDVPPFCVVQSAPAAIRALNTVGLTRAGFTSAQRLEIKRVFRTLLRSSKPLRETLSELNVGEWGPEAREFIEFYEGGKRGVVSFARRGGGEEAGAGE